MAKNNEKVNSDDQKLYLGLDIGSTSLNTVLLDENHNVIEDYYDYVHGRPFNILKDRLSTILSNHSPENIKGIAITGTGGKLATGLIGGIFVNEIIAQATSSGRLFPDANSYRNRRRRLQTYNA